MFQDIQNEINSLLKKYNLLEKIIFTPQGIIIHIFGSNGIEKFFFLTALQMLEFLEERFQK